MLQLAELNQAENEFAKNWGLSPDLLIDLHNARLSRQHNLPMVWHQIAEWIVAPVLAGFIGWMAQQPSGLYLGVMREGRLLARLMQNLGKRPAKEIWLNRNLTMLAAFGCGDDEALLNWLFRTRFEPLTKKQALSELLGRECDGENTKIVDIDGAKQFVDELNYSCSIIEVRARALSMADDIVTHWRKLTKSASPVYLMDFASAGNIQRSLQTILGARPIFHNIVGLNFSMTAGSHWAEEQGCVMRGYLAERGQPEWFASAVARTPELMEIFAAAPIGSLIGFDADNNPVCAATYLTHAQQNHIYNLQEHIVDAATHYHSTLGPRLTDDIARCLWGRLLLQPSVAEIETLADWPLDFGLDGSAKRAVAPSLQGVPEPWPKTQTAWPSASRRR